MTNTTQQIKNNIPRPPIVVVMGHIDHGKTTLLDTIRKTNVVAKESGGITQHIGAYEVVHEGKRITFLDTPGHEAFSKMRSRGARVADIAILVVAADDGVKPQTKEALAAIIEAKVSYCVAINKIDKPSADPDRVKNELAGEGVFLEGRGGTVPFVEISAKQNIALDTLLETILLMAELEDLRSNEHEQGRGVVIESHRDPQRGVTATLLVLDGTLKKNDYIVAGAARAKIRVMENFTREGVFEARPSTPVVVVGFEDNPSVGDEFFTFASQKEATAYQNQALSDIPVVAKEKSKTEPENEIPEGLVTLGLVVKTDTEGARDALLHEIAKLHGKGFSLKILRIESGDVSLDDIALARSAKNATIIAFRVGLRPGIEEFAIRDGVSVQKFSIIYDIADFLKKRIEELLPSVVNRRETAKAKIVKIFKAEGKKQIIGCRVTEGVVRAGAHFAILRRSNAIGEGRLESLQHGKIAISEVEQGVECGAQISSPHIVVVSDILVFFEEEIIKQTVS